jgi:hypothetical protein
MAEHLPTEISSGHADGPQHLEFSPGGGHPESTNMSATLPDANHRQAWSTQPTFRWFKRSDYDTVQDRWAKHEGLKGRGDNTYRPLSVVEQQAITARVDRKKATHGEPRTGEW